MCVFVCPRARACVCADHHSIAHSPQQTTWGSSAPFNLKPPTMSCSKHPHLTSGCLFFPLMLLFLKQRMQTCPPGRRFRRTLLDLMKGISAAFSRTSAFVNRRNCAEDNAVWSLFSCLFVKDIMPKLMIVENLMWLILRARLKPNDYSAAQLCCTDVFSLCACLCIVVHCHTSLYPLNRNSDEMKEES